MSEAPEPIGLGNGLTIVALVVQTAATAVLAWFGWVQLDREKRRHDREALAGRHRMALLAFSLKRELSALLAEHGGGRPDLAAITLGGLYEEVVQRLERHVTELSFAAAPMEKEARVAAGQVAVRCASALDRMAAYRRDNARIDIAGQLSLARADFVGAIAAIDRALLPADYTEFADTLASAPDAFQRIGRAMAHEQGADD